MEKHYTIALLQAINSGVAIDEALVGLRQSLAKRNHSSLYGRVLSSALRSLEQSAAHTGAVVVVAKATDADAALVKKSLVALGAELAAPRIEVDETLIGGAVVSFRHRMIDGSYKAALTKLYRAITK